MTLVFAVFKQNTLEYVGKVKSQREFYRIASYSYSEKQYEGVLKYRYRLSRLIDIDEIFKEIMKNKAQVIGVILHSPFRFVLLKFKDDSMIKKLAPEIYNEREFDNRPLLFKYSVIHSWGQGLSEYWDKFSPEFIKYDEDAGVFVGVFKHRITFGISSEKLKSWRGDFHTISVRKSHIVDFFKYLAGIISKEELHKYRNSSDEYELPHSLDAMKMIIKLAPGIVKEALKQFIEPDLLDTIIALA